MSRSLWVLLFAVAALRGATYLPTRWAVSDLAVGQVVGLQLTAAAASLLVLAAATGRLRQALGQVHARPRLAVALSILMAGAPLSLTAYAVQHVPSGIAAVLIAPTPLFAAALAAVVGIERLTARRGAGFAAGLAGVALIAGPDAAGPLAAMLALVLVAASYAAGALLLRRCYVGADAVGVALVITLPSAATLGVVLLAVDPPTAATAGPLAAALGGGAVTIGLPLVLFTMLIQRAGAARALLVSYLGPAVALALGVLLEGETLTVPAVAGLVAIVGGIALGAGSPRGSDAGASPSASLACCACSTPAPKHPTSPSPTRTART